MVQIFKQPLYSDVSRHLTTLVSPMIEALLKVQEQYPTIANDCVHTISVFFKHYPGSCGSTKGQVEKYLLSNIGSNTFLTNNTLAKCLSLIPRLGGGGKEGIYHKANFVTLFQRYNHKSTFTCL